MVLEQSLTMIQNGQIFRSHLNTWHHEIVYDPITNTKVWDKEEKTQDVDYSWRLYKLHFF